jgi:NADPH-dependent 7-cyano-7-deazaguanine reductase QueF
VGTVVTFFSSGVTTPPCVEVVTSPSPRGGGHVEERREARSRKTSGVRPTEAVSTLVYQLD